MQDDFICTFPYTALHVGSTLCKMTIGVEETDELATGDYSTTEAADNTEELTSDDLTESSVDDVSMMTSTDTWTTGDDAYGTATSVVSEDAKMIHSIKCSRNANNGDNAHNYSQYCHLDTIDIHLG